MKSLSKLLLATAAFALLPTGSAFAAKLDAPWSGTGNGVTKLVSDGSSADPRFDYDAVGAFSGAWSISAVAGTTRSVPVAYESTGFWGWYQVQTKLERFVIHNGATVNSTLAQVGPTDCCSAPSGGFSYTGTTTFDVQKGDVYGFRMSGSHYTAGPEMSGSLVMHEVDATAPTITPVITGRQGDGGYYTGPATVKWTVADDGSRISKTTGCDDATVSKDTAAAGTTFTCSATSRGGTATQSVTVKHDATAPDLTVPNAVVKQADGSGAATVTYDAGATDLVDPSPQVDCTPASGTRLALGTTTVTCSAKDAAGNTTTKTFDAIVFPGATPAPSVKPTPTPAPGLKKINPVLAFRFTITNTMTRLMSLKVKNVPAGATVTVTCKGNTCPKPLKGRGLAMNTKGSTVSLPMLVKANLRGGTTINVRITSPGAETSIKTLVVRKGKAPVVR